MMTRLRALLLDHRWLALAVTLLALAVRIAVPAGMMPGHDVRGATLIVCSGQMDVPAAMPGITMTGMTMTGMAMPKADAGKSDPAKADAPCAYTGLLAAALDTAGVPLLPALPLPVVARAVAALVGVIVPIRRLRPPLRGPPARVAA